MWADGTWDLTSTSLIWRFEQSLRQSTASESRDRLPHPCIHHGCNSSGQGAETARDIVNLPRHKGGNHDQAPNVFLCLLHAPPRAIRRDLPFKNLTVVVYKSVLFRFEMMTRWRKAWDIFHPGEHELLQHILPLVLRVMKGRFPYVCIITWPSVRLSHSELWFFRLFGASSSWLLEFSL